MNNIIEIVEIGIPRSLIRRAGNIASELIDTEKLQDELNDQLFISLGVNECEKSFDDIYRD